MPVISMKTKKINLCAMSKDGCIKMTVLITIHDYFRNKCLGSLYCRGYKDNGNMG